MGRLLGFEVDRSAIWRGAVVSAVVAIPLGLIGGLLDDDSPWLTVLTLLILASFFAGGTVAGRLRPETPLGHGALSAIPTVVVVLIIRIITRLANDEAIGWVVVISLGLLTTTIALVGGLVGGARAVRARSIRK